MYQGRTIFAQFMDFAPYYYFQQCVQRYQGNKWVQNFSCWDQFLSMSFAQMTARRSLRDIEASLGAQRHKLYHMGFSRPAIRLLGDGRTPQRKYLRSHYPAENHAGPRRYCNEDYHPECPSQRPPRRISLHRPRGDIPRDLG